MASLFQKPNSPFWQLRFKDSKGKWVKASTGLRHDDAKESAQAAVIRSEAEVKENQRAVGRVAKEGWDFADDAIDDRARYKPTLLRYQASWERILHFLMETGVSCPRDVTFQTVQDFVEWRINKKRRSGKSCSRNTAIHDLKVWAAVMQRAVQLQLCPVNPIYRHGIKKDVAESKRPFTDEEVGKILHALLSEPAWMHDSFQIALHTGCRLRETIIPLNSVKLETPGTSTITFPNPKGGKAKAFSIPMPEALWPLFSRMKAERRKVTLQMPFQPSRRWQQFFKKLKIKGVSFHCLRVTKATKLFEEDVPREAAMLLLNHSSELIHSVYVRHRVDHLRKYANAGGYRPTQPGADANGQNPSEKPSGQPRENPQS
jgi:integrase